MHSPLLLIRTLLLLLLCTATVSAAVRVDFELVTDKGLSSAATQQWFKTMTDLGVSGLRIRRAEPADVPKIDQVGTKEVPAYRVVGVVDARGTLQLPGQRFTQRDAAGITRWIAELNNNGVVGVTEKKAAYGLTHEQLESVITDLKRPVDFSTKGLKPSEIASRIARGLKIPTTVEVNAKKAIAAGEPIQQELKGLSSGTVLAAILRANGATLNPQKPDGQPVRYYVTSGTAESDTWPIGWPPEDPPAKFIPKLFEFLNAEIDGVTAAEALEALEGRLEVPMLLDHAQLAKHKIDLKKTISIPAKKTYYSKVLQQVLFQVDLKNDVRVDENGKPLFWITTIKK
ncbi:MAG: hypothetical protein SGJ20_20345 [Planctomycetota bacterium]|nr:hypothetical protein [Planctomycetota bacterium]